MTANAKNTTTAPKNITNNLTTLTAVSSLDGRYATKTQALRPIMSEFGLIYYRTLVEIKWFSFLAQHPEIDSIIPLSQADQDFLDQLVENFSEKDALAIKHIESETNHDVKAVEYWVKQQISNKETLKPYLEHVHFACTSEDINNLSYALMLKAAREIIFIPTLEGVLAALSTLATEHANLPMLSRTHGQTASPTTLGKEIANVYHRLKRATQQFSQAELLGKINGAVGNYNAQLLAYPNLDWAAAAKNFVTNLGLTHNSHTTQIEPHDCIAQYANALKQINVILLDFNRDVWTYISLGYFKQKTLANEVGSSTMPHKVNPIDFENAEGNLGLANALLNHLAEKLPISRLQRDLTDSTVLRNLGSALGFALIAYQATMKGMSKLEVNTHIIKEDINQAWEVLAEPIQTLMRKVGIANPYEVLKNFTRGKPIDQASIQAFIEDLELPEAEKNKLRALTPESYIGIAAKLATEL